jgi:hypothetical protein
MWALIILGAVVLLVALGWVAGMLTSKKASHWCPHCGRTMTCPECSRRPAPVTGRARQ